MSVAENFVPISQLNDFAFCPYSIYLHNVYMEADEGLYHAVPQTRGRVAHAAIDKGTYSTKLSELTALTVYSECLGVYGKIDCYNQEKKRLIERKYRLKHIFRGQMYQLWAEYFCMQEMGFEVEQLAFYEVSTNKLTPIALPGKQEKEELKRIIQNFRNFSPEIDFAVEANKCAHCIYINLCDKTNKENVFG